MNQEAELLQDLNSPEKSIRLQAIEYFLAKGNTEVILKLLTERRLQEPDEDCLTLLERAAGAVKKRVEGAKPRELSYELAKFADFFQAASPAERLEILSELSPQMVRSLASLAPQILENESDSFVSSGIIRTFGRTWPKDSLASLSKRIFFPNLSVRIAALEALTQIAPNSLLKELPKLLVLKDPRLRTLAVRGLAAIDMDAAIEHLDAILSQSEIPMKLAAIQACLYLPFESVKPVLLRFLAMEQTPGLLQRAGLLFEINPDVEVPFRLWELSERLPPERSDVMKKILQGACRAIQSSGILHEDISSFMDRLKTWITQRQAARFVHEVVTRIDSGEDVTPEIESIIVRRSADRFCRGMFEKALEWPYSEETKDKLRHLLGLFESPAPVSEVEKVVSTQKTDKSTEPQQSPLTQPIPVEVAVNDPEKFCSLLQDQQIRMVGSWVEKDRMVAQPILKRLIDSTDSAPDLVSASIRASIRLGIRDLGPLVEKKLKSEDPSTASAAIEYQGTFDPDSFFPRMGRFLQNPNRRIKGSALKILQHYDTAQAVSMLKAMFRGKDLEQRSNAFACLPNFDFPLIRDILVEILLSSPSEKEFNLSLCMFQANPDPGNLYDLFKLKKVLYSGQRELVSTIYQENLKFLIECGQLKAEDSGKREEEYSQKFAREQEKRAQQLKDYSVKKLTQDNLAISEKLIAFIIRLWDLFKENKKKIFPVAMIGFFSVGLIYWTVGSWEPGNSKLESVTFLHTAKSVTPAIPETPTQHLTIAESDVLAHPPPDLFIPQDKSVVDQNFKVLKERARAGKEAMEMIASLSGASKLPTGQNED